METNASAAVHVTLLRQPATGRLYLHLVNYTSAGGRPVAEPVPVGPIRLRVACGYSGFPGGASQRLAPPTGTESARERPASTGAASAPKTARLLRANRKVPLRHEGEERVVDVPRLELYEVVALG